VPHNLDPFPDRSSQQYEIRAGMRWLATAKTSGDVRIGALRHTFSDGRLPSHTGLNWLATVQWAQHPYRTFILSTGQRSDPSYTFDASYLDVKFAALNWLED